MKAALILVLAFLAFACSTQDEVVYQEQPKPKQGSGTPANLDSTVAQTCGTCHNGSTHPLKLQTTAQLKASAKAKSEIEQNAMPPGGGLAPDKKATLLSVYGS